MNIVDFWKNQVNIWNEEKKCGFCWVFGGATTRDGINRYKIRVGEECCAHVFITDESFNQVITYPNKNPFFSEINCQDGFLLWVLVPSRIDLNDYKEIDGHPIEESLEETILSPLKSCLGCEVGLDMCEAHGNLFQVSKWQGFKERRIFDNNYTGWRINVMFQEIN